MQKICAVLTVQYLRTCVPTVDMVGTYMSIMYIRWNHNLFSPGGPAYTGKGKRKKNIKKYKKNTYPWLSRTELGSSVETVQKPHDTPNLNPPNPTSQDQANTIFTKNELGSVDTHVNMDKNHKVKEW